MTAWIVDVTSAHPGTEGLVIRKWVEDAALKVEDAVTLFCRSSQAAVLAAELASVPESRTIQIEDDNPPSQEVRALILELTQDPGAEVVVMSFTPDVTRMARGLRDGGFRVELRGFGAAGDSATQDEAYPEQVVPVAEGMSALIRAVGGSSKLVRLTSIRPLLAEADQRFKKVEGTATARPRFIKSIVDEAVRRGLVALSGQDVNPEVRLTQTGMSMLAGVKNDGTPTRESRLANASNHGDGQSSQFITTLREARLGPFQEVRWEIYDAMTTMVEALDESVRIGDLIRDAVAHVRRESSFDRPNKPFPWARVRTFLMELFSQTEIFTLDGEPCEYSWASDVRMNGLASQWRVLADAQLVLRLVREGCSVEMQDIPDLAGALYNSRREEALDRVISVITHLVKIGKVAEDPQTRLLTIP